jgi:hypothetical protein
MELVKHELSVPKETKEIVDLLKAIAEKAKAGASAMDYTGLVEELFVALKGVDQIPEEIKSEYKEDIVAYLVKEVGGVFI